MALALFRERIHRTLVSYKAIWDVVRTYECRVSKRSQSNQPSQCAATCAQVGILQFIFVFNVNFVLSVRLLSSQPAHGRCWA